VNQYAVLGVPCVVSPICLQGLPYRHGENVCVAESPADFARDCIRLLTDLEFNQRIAAAARDLAMERFTWQSKWTQIRSVYAVKSSAETLPLVTVLVPSYNHEPYIRERIESILAQSYPAVELIVIDDASQDDSDAVIRSLQKQHGFKYIRNAKNSGTPFRHGRAFASSPMAAISGYAKATMWPNLNSCRRQSLACANHPDQSFFTVIRW